MQCSAGIRAGCVRLHGKKKLQQQYGCSSRMVVAGSPSAPRRFLSVPANPAPVLTQQKQESPRAGAQLPAVLRELHLPMSPMWCSPGAPGAGHARGNAQLRSCPPTCKTQTQKPDLAMDVPPMDVPPHGYSGRQSLQQLLSSQSNASSRRISGWASLPSQHHSSGFFPSVHAPEHLVDEGESEP